MTDNGTRVWLTGDELAVMITLIDRVHLKTELGSNLRLKLDKALQRWVKRRPDDSWAKKLVSSVEECRGGHA